MVKSFHQLYLPPDRLLPLQVLHLLFEINLECDFLVVPLVDPNVHSRVRPLANLLSNNVVLHRVVLREHYHFLRLSSSLRSRLLRRFLALICLRF